MLVAVLMLAAVPMLAQSQHITLLQSQGEIYATCDSATPITFAATYADLSDVSRGFLTVNATAVSAPATVLLYYRAAGDSVATPSGLSVTIPPEGGLVRGTAHNLPAEARGVVELSLWGSGTGGGFFPLSAAVVLSQ